MTLFCSEHSVPYSAVLPKAGMMRAGRLYPQAQPGLRTDERGSLFLVPDLPTPSSRDWKSGKSNLMDKNARPLSEFAVNLLPSPVARDYKGVPGKNVQMASLPREVSLLPTPSAGVFNDGEDLENWEARRQRNLAKGINGNGQGTPLSIAIQQDWGRFEGAIRKWEDILGRESPAPTVPGRTGVRLNEAFVEFLMGLPEGWVVDVPRIARKNKLRALGNGVVPQQAAMALRIMLGE